MQITDGNGQILGDAAARPIYVTQGGSSGGAPGGSTPVAAASGNVAAGTATATLPGAAGKTTYISGFEITGGGATAGSIVTATVTGTLGGTLSYNIAVPTGATTGISPLVVEFNPPLPASAANAAIAVAVPSFGAGNTNAAVVAHGYQV
ncbi:hypothetical protein [Labrys neptuniae]